MIRSLHHEPADMRGFPAEKCCLCRTPTRWWCIKKKQTIAVCPPCAKKATLKDIPLKAEWLRRERIASGQDD